MLSASSFGPLCPTAYVIWVADGSSREGGGAYSMLNGYIYVSHSDLGSQPSGHPIPHGSIVTSSHCRDLLICCSAQDALRDPCTYRAAGILYVRARTDVQCIAAALAASTLQLCCSNSRPAGTPAALSQEGCAACLALQSPILCTYAGARQHVVMACLALCFYTEYEHLDYAA